MPDITQICTITKQPFVVTEQEQTLLAKMNMPLPRRSPACRERDRMIFRNERTLYRRNCDLCKSSIISIYKPEFRGTVYCQTCWWGESWDAISYGRDYDFSRSFFDQFQDLLGSVPRCAVYNVNAVNSEYCQQAVDNKDCYLCFVSKGCESSMYMDHSLSNRDCFDGDFITQSELCYECVDVDHLYHCAYCSHCSNSNDLTFCYDLAGCHDCFGSVGLRNKEYYIFNKPYSREEYFSMIQSFQLDTYSGVERMKKQFHDFKLTQPHRHLFHVNTEDSTGNNLRNVKNSHTCYDAYDLQDCGYCTWVFSLKDCLDNYGMGESELAYQTIGDEEVQNCQFNTFVTRSSDILYSDSCFTSHNLFGCVGMKQKQYCILNKQYSKDEYEILVGKIRAAMEISGEFGEFFPSSLSPFSYNETIAQIYFPLEKEAAIAQGFRWEDISHSEYQPQRYVIPDSVAGVGDAICKEVLACNVTGKNYRITPQELSFYRQHTIPIPRKSPDQRHLERISSRAPHRMHERDCTKCGQNIVSVYSSDRPEIVYCEKCYLEAVY